MLGIYKITNPKGKIYIGQSTDIEKKLSDETKNKISENNAKWNLGKKLKHSTKQKISDNSPVKNWCYDNLTGEFFNSVTLASKELKVSRITIYRNNKKRFIYG